MLPPQQRRLTDKEHITVDATLKALDHGISLDCWEVVEGHLKDVLSEKLLLSCGDDIFRCCIRLHAERNNEQLHSPSFSGTSQSSTSDTSQEGDDRSKNNEPGSPTFVSEVRHAPNSTQDMC